MRKKRYKIVVGIDEAGRGPLSGPVIAAALVSQGLPLGNFQRAALGKNLKDSKKLSAKKREEVYEFLKKHPAVEWGIGKVGHKVIDRTNILQAAKLAMIRAVRNLEKKIGKNADFLLIDGNFGIDMPIAQKSIIKGDEKVFLIKIASIIAKVTRDRMMLRYHKKYPQYGFDRHKGYPTRLHKKMLEKYGPCRIHRKSFKPVKHLKY